MAEEPNLPGYQLDTGPYTLELYRLLCMVLADQRIAKIDRGVVSTISKLRDEYVYNELKRTLISSAIALRICLDESHTRRKFARMKSNCGKLYPKWPNEKAKFKVLSLREACNKIVHASMINEDLVVPNKAHNPSYLGVYLRPYLYLYGAKDGQDWRAVLSIIDFVKWGTEVFRRW